MKIECEFENYPFYVIGSHYSCVASQIWDLEEQKLNFVNGSHHNDKTNVDVNGIYFDSTDELKYFPTNINVHFPRIKAIYIKSRNHIRKLSSSDLRPLVELEYFGLTRSQIKLIHGDLFTFNRKLKRIIFFQNDFLNNVGENILENLNDLKQVHFGTNKCINYQDAVTPEDIQKLSIELRTRCPSLDECPSECLTKINNLQKTIDKLKISIKEISGKIEDLELNGGCESKNVWFF